MEKLDSYFGIRFAHLHLFHLSFPNNPEKKSHSYQKLQDKNHNAHVFPDTNAHFKGESPEHLYSIEFSSEELWGLTCENKHDSVTLDLWEPYLEKADGQN